MLFAKNKDDITANISVVVYSIQKTNKKYLLLLVQEGQ